MFRAKFLAVFLFFVVVVNHNSFAQLENICHLDEDSQDSSYGNFSDDGDKKNLVTRMVKIDTKKGPVVFEIHGAKQNSVYIERVARILEDYAHPILDYFEYPPTTNINFRINSSSTRANGAATAFPRNLIELNAFPPVGNGHLLTQEDWMKGLVLHELVHIVHMDQTRGFPQMVRNVFGSFGKWGGVVPRWFAEGIAVWAETEFTEGGRLRHPGVIWEFEKKMADPNFCQTIDCLDSPGKYPYGQFPYWAGAKFIDYLEKRKEGSIRCLVQENSKEIPFFLNHVFSKCFGHNASKAFKEFRESMLEDLKSRQSDLKQNPMISKLQTLDTTKEGDIVFQNDFQVLGKDLYFVQTKRKVQSLVKYNLENKESLAFRNDKLIDQMRKGSDGQLLLSQSIFNRLNEPREVTSFTNNQYKDITRHDGGDYPMLIEGDLHVLRYEKNQWKIFDLSGDKERELYAFPELYEVSRVNLITHGKRHWVKARVQAYDQTEPYQLWAVELDEGAEDLKPYQLFSTKRPFRQLTTCGSKTYLNLGDQNLAVVELTALDQSQIQKIEVPWIDQIVEIRSSDTHTVLTLKDDPQNIYYMDQGCEALTKELTREVSSKNILAAKSVQQPSDSMAILEEKYDTYPSARHFLPHWWFFNYIGGDTISTWSVYTSLNDPKDRHKFSFDLKYFPDLEQVTPDFNYEYDWSGTKLGLGHSKNYIKSSLKTSADAQQSKYVYISKNWKFHRFSYTPGLTYSEKKLTDFVGKRDTQVVNLSQGFSIASRFADSFFQGAFLGANLRYQKTENGKDFLGEEFQALTTLLPARRLQIHLNSTYGVYHKSGLVDGVLFSGGTNDFNTSAFHSFYAISKNDAFGNEVFTARAQGEFELQRMYKGFSGWELLPIYFKELNLLAGAEYLKTDFIYIEQLKGFLINKDVKAWHAGARTKMNIFYYLPVELDVLYTQIFDSRIKVDGEFLYLLRGSFIF